MGVGKGCWDKCEIEWRNAGEMAERAARGSLNLCLKSCNPTPCTLHPTPYTLHPIPQTLNPKPRWGHTPLGGHTPWRFEGRGVCCWGVAAEGGGNCEGGSCLERDGREVEHGPSYLAFENVDNSETSTYF